MNINIDDDNWSSVKLTDDVLNSYYQEFNLISLAIKFNKMKLLKRIIDYDKNQYKKIGIKLLPNHIAAGNSEIVFDILDILPDEGKIHMLGNNTCLYIFANFSNGMIKKFMKKYDEHIPYNIMDDANYYIARIYLIYNYSYNQIDMDILKTILMKSHDLILKNKNNFSLVSQGCLVGFDKDVLDMINKHYPFLFNLSDDTETTPLIHSIMASNHKLTDYLLDIKVDVNHMVGTCAIHEAIKLSNNHVIERLLKFKKLNVNYHNTDKWTTAHLCLSTSFDISEHNIKEILKRTDSFNIQNLQGYTVLHFLCVTNRLEKYRDILETKVLDIFLRTKHGDRALDMVKEPNLLLKIATSSILNNTEQMNYKGKKMKKITASDELFEKTFQTLVKKAERNEIEDKDYNIDFVDVKEKNYNIFTSFTIQNPIYALYYVEKYKLNPIMCDCSMYIVGCENRPFVKKHSEIIDNTLFVKSFVIYWRDEKNHAYPKCLFEKINRHTGITFINLTLMQDGASDHANMLLIDSNKKIVIRFEPYGGVKRHLDVSFDKFFSKKVQGYKYYSSKDYMPFNAFQAISNEQSIYNTRHFDIGGYCLAWSFWFIELYLRNQNKKLVDLINESLEKINRNYKFMDYIRSYANILANHRCSFMTEIGYPANKLFADYFTDDEYNYTMQSVDSRLSNSRKYYP